MNSMASVKSIQNPKVWPCSPTIYKKKHSPMLIPMQPLYTQNYSPLHPPQINLTLTILVSAKPILKI